MGSTSTELARTVALLAVDALEMSRMNAGRSGCNGEELETSSTGLRQGCEAFVLALGEGFDDAGVERGMVGDE
jgi:hypothetical protein